MSPLERAATSPMQTGLAASFSVFLTLALYIVFYVPHFLVVNFATNFRNPGNPEANPLLDPIFWILINYVPHLAAYLSSFALTKRIFPKSNLNVVFGALSALLLVNAALIFFLFMTPSPVIPLFIVMGLGTLTFLILFAMLPVQKPSKPGLDP